MDQKKIGKFIAECRKEKGLTQAELAEKFGISNRAVSKWETGKSFPDPSVMANLCDLLGISPGELLCGERIAKQDTESKRSALRQELRALRLRIVLNNVFLLAVAVAGAFASLWLLLPIGALAVFRNIFLFRHLTMTKKRFENVAQTV